MIQIEKIKGSLNTLKLKLHTGEFEAAPPEATYYYNPESLELIILEVNVGHETFATRYSYYFNNSLVIKYIKEILHRADSPPKQAIIFKNDDTILWGNIDAPVLSSNEVIELYKSNMSALRKFSKYSSFKH